MRKTGSAKYHCKYCYLNFDTLNQVYQHDMKTHVANGLQRNKRGTKRRKNSGNLAAYKKSKDGRNRHVEVNELLVELETEIREGLLNNAEGTELHFLCRLFQLDPENMSNIHRGIVGDLYDALNADKLAGQWNVQAFGSTVTGMAFKDSDIDFYIRPQFYNDSFHNQFNRVYILLSQSGHFTKIVPIRSARVPILKCKHQCTGVNLDINLSSSSGVYNSEIISKLFISDSRIHPLMLVLKIWAKSWDITKPGRMTNYCLILLVIFYLQNCSEPILPPLNYYQKNIKPRIIHGINFAFNDMLRFRTQNRDNIKQLVIDFFKFYSGIDFAKVIISPYLGIAINRFEFVSGIFSFPAYYQQLKAMNLILQENMEQIDWMRDIRDDDLQCHTLMVVQDPFCLNSNTSKGVGIPTLELFKKQIAHGNKICSRPSTPGQLLLRLFFEKPPNDESPITNVFHTDVQLPSPIKTTPSKTATQNPPVRLNSASTKANKLQLYTCRLTPMETELFYIRQNLRNAFPNKSFTKTEIDKMWCKNSVQYIKNVLTDLFKFSFQANGNTENNELKVNGTIIASADTWSKRKYDAKKGPAAFLKEQTDYGKLFTNQVGTDSFLINGRLNIKVDEINFPAVIITMEPIVLSTNAALQALFNAFTSRIRVFFKAYFALEK